MSFFLIEGNYIPCLSKYLVLLTGDYFQKVITFSLLCIESRKNRRRILFKQNLQECFLTSFVETEEDL